MPQQPAAKRVPPARSSAPARKAPAPARGEVATVAQIMHLMDLVGTRELMTQMLQSFLDEQIAELKQLPGDAPPKFWDDVAADARASMNVDEMLGLMVPIYQKHFTASEIQGIIAFYESPTGHKLAAELPQVQAEAMEAGQRWSERVGREMADRAAQREIEQENKASPKTQP